MDLSPTALPAARAAPADPGKIIDLRALALTLWRGKIWVLSAAFLAMVLAAIYGFLIATPIYRASAVVILETRQEQIVDLQNVMSGLSGDAMVVNSEVEVMRSRSLLGRVVKDLNLTQDPEFNGALVPPSLAARARAQIKSGITGITGIAFPDPPPVSAEVAQRQEINRTINQLRRQMSVKVMSQSVVFEIAVETTSPAKSAAIANAVADQYVLEQLEVKFEATEKATAWLTERVADLRQDLEAKQARLKEFSSRSNLINPAALEALNRRVKELRARIAEAEGLLATQAAHLDALRDSPPDWPARVALTEDPVLTRLLREEAPVPLLQARFNLLIDRAETTLDRRGLQLAQLKASEPPLLAEIEAQNADLVVLEQLQREAQASGLLYEYFLNRLKETSIQQGIQQADSRILSQAVVPLAPSSPRRYLLMVMAAVLGGLAGAGMTTLRESLQNTYRTGEELEAATGRPVLGQIPRIPAKARADVFAYLREKPTSAAAEAIRNLRTSILMSNVDAPPQVILSTSSLPGEGKTTQSLALAQNIAAMGQKVLLIEGDIRRRVFRDYFKIDRQEGLLSVVGEGRALSEVTWSDPALGFDILMGEEGHMNAADLFSSRAFGEMITQARATYDRILIDTPPVLAVPDARVIGQLADAVLYTVRWDQTRRDSVTEGLRLFETVHVPVTGLVLAQIDPKGVKRYGHGGAYGAYDSAYYHD